MSTPREAELEALILEALEDLEGVPASPKTWMSRARAAVNLNPANGYVLATANQKAKP